MTLLVTSVNTYKVQGGCTHSSLDEFFYYSRTTRAIEMRLWSSEQNVSISLGRSLSQSPFCSFCASVVEKRNFHGMANFNNLCHYNDLLFIMSHSFKTIPDTHSIHKTQMPQTTFFPIPESDSCTRKKMNITERTFHGIILVSLHKSVKEINFH